MEQLGIMKPRRLYCHFLKVFKMAAIFAQKWPFLDFSEIVFEVKTFLQALIFLKVSIYLATVIFFGDNLLFISNLASPDLCIEKFVFQKVHKRNLISKLSLPCYVPRSKHENIHSKRCSDIKISSMSVSIWHLTYLGG